MPALAALVLAYGCGACLAGGHPGIAAIQSDGTHPRAVLTASIPSHRFWQPSWAPDGKRFVYVHEDGKGNRRLWIARGDGAPRHPITTGDDAFYPAWSPDGRQIAFIRDYELWIVGADGSRPHRIVTRRHGAIFDPFAWSPDGRRLAFVADTRLYLVRADGSGLLRLRTTPAADPAFSPDGRSVYYMSGRDNGFVPWVPHRYDLATGRDVYFLARPGADYVAGAWSPDRRLFAYALILPTADGSEVNDLWILRLADRRRIHVTRVAGDVYGIAWKP